MKIMKFRNLLKVVIAIVAVATVVSCSKDEKSKVEEPAKGHRVTVKVNNAPQEDGTKLNITGSTYLMAKWKAGDAIAVVYHNSSDDTWHCEQFTLVGGGGSYQGVFSNDASELDEYSEYIRAYYPYVGFDGAGKLPYNISAQTGVQDQLGSKLHYYSMYAMNYDTGTQTLSGANMYLRNNGFIRLKPGLLFPGFESVTATDAVLTIYGSEIGSSMLVDAQNSYPTYEVSSGVSDPITISGVSITNGVLDNEILFTSYYRGTDDNDITFKLTKGGTEKTYSFIRYIRDTKVYNISTMPAMSIEYSPDNGANWYAFNANPFCYPPTNQIKLRAIPSDGEAHTYIFATSDPSAVDVEESSGIVTFLGTETAGPTAENHFSIFYGSATITVHENETGAEKTLNLCSNVYYQTTPSYSGSWTTIPFSHTMNPGDNFTFRVFYNNNNFNGCQSPTMTGAESIYAESSNTSVATIDYQYGNPKVTAVAAGTADIIVHFGTVWSKKYATVTVE